MTKRRDAGFLFLPTAVSKIGSYLCDIGQRMEAPQDSPKRPSRFSFRCIHHGARDRKPGHGYQRPADTSLNSRRADYNVEPVRGVCGRQHRSRMIGLIPARFLEGALRAEQHSKLQNQEAPEILHLVNY